MSVASLFTYQFFQVKKFKKIALESKHQLHDIYAHAKETSRLQMDLLRLMEENYNSDLPKEQFRSRLNQIISEQTLDPTRSASGFQNIAIQAWNQKTIQKSFEAIESLSTSININFSESNQKLISDYLGIANYQGVIGFQNKEIPVLTKIIDEELKKSPKGTPKSFLCATRLAQIYKFGKASASDEILPPNYKKALEYRKHALSQIKIDKKNPVDIVIIIDDKFAPHAGVTIASALLNANPDTFYTFHFLMDPDNLIIPENQNKLKQLKNIIDCDFDFKVFPDNVIPEEFMKDKGKDYNFTAGLTKWPRLILYRMFLDKVYANKDTLLYLDADLIIKKDLNKLYAQNMDKYSTAGALDYSALNQKYNCSHKKIKTYVNSGVLLFNLKEWRNQNINQKVIDEINFKKCRARFFDQDIINRSTADNLLIVPSVWNYSTAHKNHLEINPFIHHLYGVPKGQKKIQKPWKQEGAEQFWKTDYTKIPHVFWDYWAARDITPWPVKE